MKFAIWCTRKCLHLWDPPKEIFIWLNDPENYEKAKKAQEISDDAWGNMFWKNTTNVKTISDAILLTSQTVWVSRVLCARKEIDTKKDAEIMAVEAATNAAEQAALMLNTTGDALKHEFVSTWTDEELKIIDPEWADYINAEIFAR